MKTDFEKFVQEKSRQIAPDYPKIQKDLEPWEHLWAITSAYEGTEMANKNCHEMIKYMAGLLGWDDEKVFDEWMRLKNKKEN